MNSAKSIKEILTVYHSKIKSLRKLNFLGVGDRNVFNITAPFNYEGQTYILGRVENPKDETSLIHFFKEKKENYELDKSFQHFELEDPSLTKIRNEYVLSGVEVKRTNGKLRWRTVFYKGKELKNLKQFSSGPWGMKDIRLIELNNNKIGVFTRPRGRKGARGKIGYIEIDSLEHLRPQTISKAQIISYLFSRGEWGGANDILILRNEKIGVLGHIARFSKEGNKYYYPMVFAFDSKSKESSNIKIIGSREEIPKGKSRHEKLYNVVFPGGIIRKEGNLAALYVGVSDAESYEIIIEDPFESFEEQI